MAIIGLCKLIASPKLISQDKTIRLFSLAFFCLWLPLLISLPDAVNFSHSAHTVFPYLRFFFAGIFVITEIAKNKDRLNFVIAGIFFIVLFWCVDASIQFFFNENLLGFPYESGHITGMFYPRNTISHICSALSTFCFLYVFLNADKKKWWIVISLLPLFFIVLLSGRRAAWIMLGLSMAGFLWFSFKFAMKKKGFLKLISIITMLSLIMLGSTVALHKPLNERFKTTLGLFSTDYQTVDKATAFRLPLWETAFTIFKKNPVNGIGPRGYRHVYTEYSTPDNFWHELTQTHPHLLLLEVLCETGLIGLTGYLLLLYILISIFRQSPDKTALFPFIIPVFVALFPFNAHMAFYGSIWSSMCWLLIALFFTKAKQPFNYNN